MGVLKKTWVFYTILILDDNLSGEDVGPRTWCGHSASCVDKYFRFLCECPVCALEEAELEEAEKKSGEGAESGKETDSEKGQSKKTEDGDVEKETGSKKADDLDEEATHIEPLQAAWQKHFFLQNHNLCFGVVPHIAQATADSFKE